MNGIGFLLMCNTYLMIQSAEAGDSDCLLALPDVMRDLQNLLPVGRC
jgi:hypothetical protein